MSALLLTYIVPVYNTEAYLKRCLESLLDQGIDADQYEVLVVDDGSTDGSRAVIESFAASHPQVHLIEQANAGVSAARNLAISRARGRYLQFVDSDDYLQRGLMAGLLSQAVDNELDALVFNYKRVDEGGNELLASQADIYPDSAVLTGVEYLEKHCMTPYIWRFLVNRAYLNQNQWRFDESLIVCEDGELIARLLLNAHRVAHASASPYRYVNRGGSAMHLSDRDYLQRRVMSQVESAASINATMRRYEQSSGCPVPASVSGLRNVYLYFAMTKALTSGCVKEVLQHMRQAGLYPFPCVGAEANYYGKKWKIIHTLMMHPRLWSLLSKVYQLKKK